MAFGGIWHGHLFKCLLHEFFHYPEHCVVWQVGSQDQKCSSGCIHCSNAWGENHKEQIWGNVWNIGTPVMGLFYMCFCVAFVKEERRKLLLIVCPIKVLKGKVAICCSRFCMYLVFFVMIPNSSSSLMGFIHPPLRILIGAVWLIFFWVAATYTWREIDLLR